MKGLPSCQSCRWARQDRGEKVGWLACGRFPPTAGAEWALVHDDDDCGEWKEIGYASTDMIDGMSQEA